MSRNLGSINCAFCNSYFVTLMEPERDITQADCGIYFQAGKFSYQGMRVANAECSLCGGKYLAWIDMSACHSLPQQRREGWGYPTLRRNPDVAFFDLSFRSTFNDEPGPEDAPTHYLNLLVNSYSYKTRTAAPSSESDLATRSAAKACPIPKVGATSPIGGPAPWRTHEPVSKESPKIDMPITTKEHLAHALFVSSVWEDVARKAECDDVDLGSSDTYTERVERTLRIMWGEDKSYARERERCEKLAARTWSARRVGWKVSG